MPDEVRELLDGATPANSVTAARPALIEVPLVVLQVLASQVG